MPTTVSYNILTATDDVSVYSGGLSPNGNLWIGANQSQIEEFFLRFQVNIPKNATIQSASIRFYNYYDDYMEQIVCNIKVEDVPNATMPTTYAQYTGKTLSSGYMQWIPPRVSIDTIITTPDISALVQSIVNKSTYQANNYIGIYFKNTANNGGEPTEMAFYSYDTNWDKSPMLTITYVDSGVSTNANITGVKATASSLFNAPIITAIKNVIITVKSFTKSKISDETGMTTCTVVFQSDQDLIQWEARADGTGQGSGLLVGSGTTVTANTDVSFDVTYDELTLGDKTYRINIYGKNTSGSWSIYG